MSTSVVTCSASSIVGINNFGDELLTEIYHEWIGEIDPTISVHHLVVDGHGVLSRETRDRIRSASFLMFTGGGYFADGDYKSGHTVRRHARALRNRRVYWTVFKEARRHHVPCAVFGLEVGPLANPFYRTAVSDILRAAKMVVVRNTESRSFVERLCGGAVDATVRLDAALAGRHVPKGERVLPPRSGGDFRIGLHIHSFDGEVSFDESVDLVNFIISRLSSDRQADLYFFHDQRKQGVHPSRSVRAEQSLAAAFPGLTSVPYDRPLATAMAVGEMDLVVTSKLHLGIVARSFGVPVLAIGGHPKIRRFYQSIGEGAAWSTPRDLVANGLPGLTMACLVAEEARIPIGDEFRQSALGNRAAVQKALERAKPPAMESYHSDSVR